MWWWKRRVHRSWAIALGCLSFVIGVWLGASFSLHGLIGVAGALAGLGATLYSVRWSLAVVACGFLVAGVGYGAAHVGERSVYAHYLGQVVELSGRIKEDPTASGQRRSLQIDSVTLQGGKVAGTVLVSIISSPDVKRGDIVTVTGELRPAFGSFPAAMSVLHPERVERPVPGDVGRVVRDWFADEVRELIPDPQASLGIGFLTGQKSALPEDLSEALRIAGLTHIVVASGYNLTILVRMARRLFLRVSKYLSAIAAATMIVAFVGVTGMSPSMTRAGLVSGLSLLAWYYGHAFHPFILLPIAAAITVAWQPSYVWGDLGWQLSFAAFAGVMIVAPLLQRYFFGEAEPNVLRQILGETLAAHAVTVPLIALSFGTVSHVAIIANLLVVPLVPLAMLLTFGCGLWAISSLPLAFLLAEPTTWLLTYMTSVATFVSELSWAQTDVTVSGWIWLGYGAILGLVCLWMQRATKYSFRGTEPIIG